MQPTSSLPGTAGVTSSSSSEKERELSVTAKKDRYSLVKGEGEPAPGSQDWLDKAAIINTSVEVTTPQTSTDELSSRTVSKPILRLEVKIASYEDFRNGNAEAIQSLKKGLLEDGIIGIRGIPRYQELSQRFISAARAFAKLDPSIKEELIPKRGTGEWLGPEEGKEKFKGKDGVEVTDTSKSSYYAYVNHGNLDSTKPTLKNVWPKEEKCDLQKPFLEMGQLMFEVGREVFRKLGHFADDAEVNLDNANGVGRMLRYKQDPKNKNHLCGEHADHGLFTALMRAHCFENNSPVPEPQEGGLFIKLPKDGEYYKVDSNDPDVMFFQVGEFAQLGTNGEMKATRHLVRRYDRDDIERFTMAVFINPEDKARVHSTDPLSKEYRYTHRFNEKREIVERTDGCCEFLDWHLITMDTYEVKK